MGVDRLVEKVQNRPPLQAPRSYDGQNTLHEAAAAYTVAAQRTPTPQHRATLGTLHVVVRRLHAFYGHERLHCRHLPRRLFTHQHLRSDSEGELGTLFRRGRKAIVLR
jgi:hypothetical protein